jgi:N6-L-threonylcarbamoyladenine synthase
MKVLGIETTCDETSIAVVEDGYVILSNIVFSQAKTHTDFGGVVPELASRGHIEAITFVLDQALNTANISLNQIDLIAAAVGPGLLGALIVGIQFAKALSLGTKIPLIGINHIEAHLFGAIMKSPKSVHYPAIGAILSGGHTQFLFIKEPNCFELIGSTVDDAIGEAFDKVAKMLDLGYPGGPIIEQYAKMGNSHKYSFHGGQVKKRPFDLSFSGLKTSVLYTLFGQDAKQQKELSMQEKYDAAASFQQVATQIIADKLAFILKHYDANTLIFGGGVTCNQTLKAKIYDQFPNHSIFWPDPILSLDNGAMIAGLGFVKYKANDGLALEAHTRIDL